MKVGVTFVASCEVTCLLSHRVFCGTYNVNGKAPPPSLEEFLLEYELKDEKVSQRPDIYAIG